MNNNYLECQIMRLHAYITYCLALGGLITRESMLEHLEGILHGNPKKLELLDSFLDPNTADNKCPVNLHKCVTSMDKWRIGCKVLDEQRQVKDKARTDP
jgi:hypothetical protein